MRVIFLGRGRLGMEILDRLLEERDVDVAAVFTCRATPEVGLGEQDFAQRAADLGIGFHKTNNLNTDEWSEVLRSYEADLGVSVSWLHVIGDTPILSVKKGILNVHAGLLPRYRGNACQTWAILNRESEIGVTCHLMEPGNVDSGPIVLQEVLPVLDSATVGELLEAAEDMSARLMVEAVRMFAADDVRLRPQESEHASYCYPRLPRDGEIDWSSPAEDIARLIRAAGPPYPGAYSYFEDVLEHGRIKKLRILKAHVEDHELPQHFAVPGHMLKVRGDRRGIEAGDGKLVVLDEIEVDGHPVVPGRFFRSVRQRLGLDTQALIALLHHKVTALEASPHDRHPRSQP